MIARSSGMLPRSTVTLSPINLAKGHVAAPRSSSKLLNKFHRPSRIYASGNESSHTSFNISPPGDSNALWSDDDVLEVPSLRDQLYPRSVYASI